MFTGRHNPVILSAAGVFKKITGKGGGVEYLILNFYLPKGHVKSNVQSIGDIISFRIYRYDTYFHHDVRGHGAGVTLPRSMRMDLGFLGFFCNFPTDVSIFFSLCLSSYFPFYFAFISYFCFGLACSLRQAGLLKKDKVKVDFHFVSF